MPQTTSGGPSNAGEGREQAEPAPVVPASQPAPETATGGREEVRPARARRQAQRKGTVSETAAADVAEAKVTHPDGSTS